MQKERIAKFKNCIKNSLKNLKFQIINLSLCKSHERDYDVCVNEGRRENKRLSILRPSSSGRESHPVQEVFLPSRWAATEMKISHLNFFAFVSLPRLRDTGSTGGTELGIWGTIVMPPRVTLH